MKNGLNSRPRPGTCRACEQIRRSGTASERQHASAPGPGAAFPAGGQTQTRPGRKRLTGAYRAPEPVIFSSIGAGRREPLRIRRSRGKIIFQRWKKTGRSGQKRRGNTPETYSPERERKGNLPARGRARTRARAKLRQTTTAHNKARHETARNAKKQKDTKAHDRRRDNKMKRRSNPTFCGSSAMKGGAPGASSN